MSAEYVVTAEVEILANGKDEDEAAMEALRILDSEADIITGIVMDVRVNVGAEQRLAPLNIERAE